MNVKKNTSLVAMSFLMTSIACANENTTDERAVLETLVETHVTENLESSTVENLEKLVTENVLSEISPTDAAQLLENFINNVSTEQSFVLNNTKYIVTEQTKINPVEITIIETIASQVIDSALTTASEIIETQVHAAPAVVQTISQQDVANLIEQFVNNLAAGTTFTINGTTYSVQTPVNN